MVPKFRKGDLVVLRLQEKVVSDTSSRRIVLKCFGRVGTIENVVNYVFGIDYDVKLSCDGSDYVIRVNEHDLGEFHAPDYSSMYSAIKKSPVTDCVIRTDGVFYVLKDGSRWNVVTGEKVPDFKGEHYRHGEQGVSEDTAQELINRMSAIRNHVKNPFEGIVFGGGRDYGKSWLKDWLETERKVVEDIVANKKMPSFVAPRYVLKMDLDKFYAKMPEPESKPESKMTKERCVKLLEAYRAEREKVAKGRKFERCLRDSVVNEALERAIELLKG